MRFTGFYKLQANGVINIINEATKLLALPGIPKFQVGGDYWRDKKMVAEAATTMSAAVMAGGTGIIGEAMTISASGASLAEGAIGHDLRSGEALGTLDRLARGGGGLLGAYASRQRVEQLTDVVANSIRNARPPGMVAEAITPEGLRLRLAEKRALSETLAQPLESRVQSRINIRVGNGSKSSGLDYALRKHGGSGTVAKSQFTISRADVIGLLKRKDVAAALVRKDALSGNFIREVDVEQIIGRTSETSGGRPTSVITVITDEAGNLVNVFPGNLYFGAKLP
ncbi:MAG: hypothetical protein WKF84_14300 [Pyrinomonadaceae bacterium]